MNSVYNQPALLPVVALALFASMTEAKAQQQNRRQDEAYVSPSVPEATGKAPGMKIRLLSENAGVKHYVLILANGDDVMSGLTDVARRNTVTTARFAAIGACSPATLPCCDAT